MNPIKQKDNLQKQVKQHSGNVIHPNLDEDSLYLLRIACDEHKKRGQHLSQSVLVRRAVRVYGLHMSRMAEEDYGHELTEIKRAMKGIC